MRPSVGDSYRIECYVRRSSRVLRPQENLRSTHCAPVAQMDRALASGAKGRGFESLLARQLNRVRPGHVGDRSTGYMGNNLGRTGLGPYSHSTERPSEWRL
jgi:hypothetical protein